MGNTAQIKRGSVAKGFASVNNSVPAASVPAETYTRVGCSYILMRRSANGITRNASAENARLASQEYTMARPMSGKHTNTLGENHRQ